MPFPKLLWWQWCLCACAAIVLLLPAGLAVVAPALAPLPAAAAAPRWEAPPLPDRETPLPGFQDLLDPLPLVVRDLPDPASRDVVAAYDKATLFDPQPSRDMLAAAERAIPVPADLETSWNYWIRALDSASGDPAPIPDAILQTLQADPRNGDRLSNLAVAYYFAVLTENPNRGVNADRRDDNTLRLLAATSEAFPDSRAILLNYAFLSSFIRLAKLGSESSNPVLVRNPITHLAAWMAAHPEDVTALQLLVFETLNSSGAVPEDPAIVSELNRLADMPDAARAALAHAFLGDLKLKSAYAQRVGAPFTAQETARQALQEYDKALELSDDPSIYSARAETLEFLGVIPSAFESQKRAAELQPDSMPLLLRLGDLYREQQGDELQVMAAMREAREQYRRAFTLAEDQKRSPISDIQLRVYNGEFDPNAPVAGSEYTAFRPSRTYVSLNPWAGMAGGGYILSYDLIPKYEQQPYVVGEGLPAERSASNAIVASVALGDPQGATEDANKLFRFLGDSPDLAGPSGARTRVQELAIPAAQLVAGRDAQSHADDSVLGFAVISLRFAGLYQQAASLCRTSDQLRCLGENAYLAGDYGVARKAFADLGDPLYEGFVAQVVGDSDGAVRLYQSWLSKKHAEMETMRGVVTAWLGNAYLDSGDVRNATASYGQVIERIDRLGGPFGSADRLALQHAQNNRGIARLRSQMRSGAGPDCSGKGASICQAALADFEAALRSDPYNPVYLLGKAWAERLLGNPEAAVQTLNQAVQIDPTLFPALNDLGVLAIQSGDLPRARQALTDALAANPKYDLALWNIGVLEMQRGVRGVPRGQAYLARAIAQNPTFASSGLSYRTDEEIYRVEFNERLKAGAGWTFASATSVATTAFGLITILVIILGAIDYLITDKIQSAASARAAEVATFLDRMIGHKLSLPSGDGLFPWLPLLTTIPALAFATSWSALRENPGTAAANVVLALFATLTAVVVHETGHALAAWKVNAQILPAQWGPGTLLALVLLPIHLNAGPYPGQRVICEDEEAVWWVHLGGPLANLLVAVGAYALFLVRPLPGLRLIALVQFAAMSYALLPFEPLDGAALARSRPVVVSGLSSLVLIGGLLFSIGAF